MPVLTNIITTQSLEVRIKILLALSSFFAKGGENLSETLGQLSKACSRFADLYDLKDLAETKKILQQYSQAEPKELILMNYEFNRLFVGPTPPSAPPYGSVYLSSDHLVMQEQTLFVRKLYLAENLQVVGQGSEPDDFLATELEFSAYLLARAIEARLAGDEKQVQSYLSLYEEFWSKHLGRWLEPFVQAIYQSARHPVFLAVGQVLISLRNIQ